jgi:hypothetical protein
MILPTRGESVDTGRRAEIRRLLKPQSVVSCIDSMMAVGRMRLSQLLKDSEIYAICDKLGMKYRKRGFPPPTVLGLFVVQMLSRSESCATTVSRLNKERKEQGLLPMSSDASAYCKARSRLPLALIDAVNDRVCSVAYNQTEPEWKMFGRDIYFVDGFTLRAPDVQAVQARYPQPSTQKPGLGFPLVRLVVATSLATGCIHAYKTAPCKGKKNGEATLFRSFIGKFKKTDIIVADSNFESYNDLSLLNRLGMDGVLCINGTRIKPFGGVCECIDDMIKKIAKPKFDSVRWTREEWEALPNELTIRMIRYRTDGRSDTINIVTTLIDLKAFPARDITTLYGLRWDVEIDIGCIKTTMGQGELRCLTADNIDREIAVTILAYNTVRLLSSDAAQIAELHPRQISFSCARDAWITFGKELETAYDLMWLIVTATGRFVRDRPGRHEPRAIKKRNTKYPILKEPRPSKLAAMALSAEGIAA